MKGRREQIKIIGMKAHLRQWFWAVVAVSGILPASAYDFQVDGIYYDIHGDEVSVTYDTGNSIGTSYSGAVVIPASVTYEGKTYSVTSIGNSAFYNCSGLTSVTMPESVTSIGRSAFGGCSGLTSVAIPETVTTIGESAFSGCIGLTSVAIPESVTTIEGYAFRYCIGLTSVTWNARTCINNGSSSPFSGSNVETFVLGENVEQIPADLCRGLTGLTSVTIPQSVTTVGSYAFYDCSGLTSVVISESVESIGAGAFGGCSGLTSVVIPESVESIGASAFSGCSGLTSVVIPESVTSIGYSAFYNCSGLTTVTIPESIMTIGENVFRDCSGLTSVTIPESITTIGKSAFSGCSGLTTVAIPDSVTTIGENAFWGCSGLTSVTWNARNGVPADATASLFQDAAHNIETFVFGENVEQIPACLCKDMSSLASIALPQTLTSIGDNAFSGCTSLTSIIIPPLVAHIGDMAFATCLRLESVTTQAMTPPEIWATTFDDYGMPLYVPAGSKSKYQSAKYWRNFTNMQETGAARYTVELYSSDESMGTVMGAGEYDEGALVTLAAIPASGYHFVQWSDGNTENPRQITVTEDVSLTAEFSASCKLSVCSNDDTMGSVTAVLTATPKEGYRFVQWSDGNTENPRTVFVTESADLVAEFEAASTGMESASADKSKIYVIDRTLHVENAGEAYRVYTAAGQLVYAGNDTAVSLSDAGVYVVRIKERTQKVVVK